MNGATYTKLSDCYDDCEQFIYELQGKIKIMIEAFGEVESNTEWKEEAVSLFEETYGQLSAQKEYITGHVDVDQSEAIPDNKVSSIRDYTEGQIKLIVETRDLFRKCVAHAIELKESVNYKQSKKVDCLDIQTLQSAYISAHSIGNGYLKTLKEINLNATSIMKAVNPTPLGKSGRFRRSA